MSSWKFWGAILPDFAVLKYSAAETETKVLSSFRGYSKMVAIFFVVSTVNNMALSYRIPVPLHIIFRSVSIIIHLYIRFETEHTKMRPRCVHLIWLVHQWETGSQGFVFFFEWRRHNNVQRTVTLRCIKLAQTVMRFLIRLSWVFYFLTRTSCQIFVSSTSWSYIIGQRDLIRERF